MVDIAKCYVGVISDHLLLMLVVDLQGLLVVDLCLFIIVDVLA